MKRAALVFSVFAFCAANIFAETLLLGHPKDFGEVAFGGMKWTEGPAFKDGKILFSEVPLNTIYSFEKGGKPEIFKRPACAAFKRSDNDNRGSNGLGVDPQNRLLICDEGNRSISRLNESDFTVEILCSQYDGKRLNSPNDIVIAKDGRVFFTDPPFGLKDKAKSKSRELDFCGVFLLSQDGELKLLDGTLKAPNGIGLTRDEKRLIIAQSGGIDEGWFVYDIEGDTLKNRKKFCSTPEEFVKKRGSSDGFCTDEDGTIYASGRGGLYIFSPDLKLLGVVGFDYPVSNCCIAEFGGVKYIFTTGRGDAYLLELEKLKARAYRK